MNIIRLIILLLTCSMALAATQDLYGFSSPQQLQRFQQLTQEMRCVVCQNQSLADSAAPLAEDLRRLIASQVKQGVSNQAIIAYLQQRYGHFILYRPPLMHSTYPLWFLPLLLLLLGFAIVFKQKGLSGHKDPSI